MFNRRFTPYIIAATLIACLSALYLGYRAYQNHVEFETFISKSLTFQRPLNKESAFSKHTGRDNSMSAQTSSEGQVPNSIINEISPLSKPTRVRWAPPHLKSRELPEYMLQQLKTQKSVTLTPENTVRQIVETPDGETHEVYVIQGMEFKEGDSITEADLTRPRPLSGPEIAQIEAEALRFRNSPPSDKIVHFRKSEVPEGESIEMYGFKRRIAELEGVSMDEVNRMIATGETKIEMGPITEEMIVDSKEFLEKLGIEEAPPESFRDKNNRSGAQIPIVSSSGSSPIPLTPSESKHIHHEDRHGYKTQSTENTETQLRAGLSEERFSKAQQLIDRYGSEEGLRRFREIDPEAARQFEREGRPPPAREVPGKTESSTR